MRSVNQLTTERFPRRVLLLALLIVLGISAAKAVPPRAQKGLTVAITTDRDVYQIGEEVRVTFTLDNQTGQPIQLKGTTCTPLFDLIALETNGQEAWRASECPSCCCTCCPCPIGIVERVIPTGITQYPNDVVWRQVRIAERGRCGCVTAQVNPGVYYLVGQVRDVRSEPVRVEIR